jgi:DNA-binding transcriptional LysR family regulator
MPFGHKLPHMDLRHARTFVTIAELGTVSAAALRLRIAQPALSRQLEALERELGLLLFDRVGRRLVLTGAGEQLVRECRDLLNAADTVAERARLLQRGNVGVLRVAASPQFIEGVLAGFLQLYAKSYPDVQIVLREAIGWPDVARMLECGDVHLGQNLLHALPPSDLRLSRAELEPVDLLAVCARSRRFATGKTIEMERLAEHPLLLLDGSFIFRRTFDAACRLAGIKPKIMFESRTPHTLLAMAERGHGVAVIPSALRVPPATFRIVRVTYRGEPLREPLAVYWQTRRPLPPYGGAFLDMLRAYVREVFPVTRPT